MDAEELLGYEELATALGKTVGAVRNMKLRGQLPEPDAPGPRWRRSSLAALLSSGTRPRAPALEAAMVAGAPPVAAAPRSGPGAPPDAPVLSTERTAAPVAAPAPPRPPFEGEDAEDRRRRSMTLADVLACTHPEGDRKRTGYMTMCLVCGRHQRGADRWSGAGYAGWTPGWQATCPHPRGERIARPWGPVCEVCGTLVG